MSLVISLVMKAALGIVVNLV